MDQQTYLRNRAYREQQAEQNPSYGQTPYILAVKQLEHGRYGIGKVTAMHGTRFTAWEWVRHIDTGQPLAFSNTYRAILEKQKLEFGTVAQWRQRWGVE